MSEYRDLIMGTNAMWPGKKSVSNEFNGFLDAGTSITGELRFSGTLRIDGNIHGSITTPDRLIVGEKAVVHADIKAGEVAILGTVSGNIECERSLQICPSGRLRGDVQTPKLVIEDGGVFEGLSRCVKGSEQDQLQLEETTKGQSEVGKELIG